MKHRKLIIVALALALLLTACASNLPAGTVKSLRDLPGKNIGVLAGSSSAAIINEMGLGAYVREYATLEELLEALSSGSCDAAICEGAQADSLVSSRGISELPDPIYKASYRIAVSQENTGLIRRINSAVAELKKNPERAKDKVPADAPRVTVAFCGDLEPVSYLDENGLPAGREVEAVKAICNIMGVIPEFQTVSRDKLMYYAQSGKVSMAVGRIESGQGVLLSEPCVEIIQRVIIRK